MSLYMIGVPLHVYEETQSLRWQFGTGDISHEEFEDKFRGLISQYVPKYVRETDTCALFVEKKVRSFAKGKSDA